MAAPVVGGVLAAGVYVSASLALALLEGVRYASLSCTGREPLNVDQAAVHAGRVLSQWTTSPTAWAGLGVSVTIGAVAGQGIDRLARAIFQRVIG